jgi:hypothetical protein
MITSLRRRADARREHGAALIWTALAMTAILGAASFAIDLGWIYLNATRLQAAADSAALAGVVNLPGFPATAEADATTAAANNGFNPAGAATLTDAVLADNRYQVTLEAEIPTFFLPILGFDSMNATRTAVAEYIKPVKLGSPENQFGGPSQDFWASINGQYTDREQGDPYATRCIQARTSSSSPSCSSTNPWYRDGGYYYAVEVAPGATDLQVQIFDPGHYITGGSGAYQDGTSDPGDTSWYHGTWGSKRGVALEAKLYAPDATPSDPSDNPDLRCSNSWGTIADSSLSSSQKSTYGYESWRSVCSSSIGSPTAGIWVLQLPPPQWEGATKFAIRATTNGPEPKVYGLLDMSIHVNIDSGDPEPYLAEVRPEHAGKTLQVDIFDLGESSTMTMKIRDNEGDVVQCTYDSTNGYSSTTPSNCSLNVGGAKFDKNWLYLSIPIPDDYDCDPTQTYDCWWRIDISNMSNSRDRTTWTARITGDPVRLIE